MAAKVMRQATERETMTVHKMLRILPYDDTAKGRDLNDPVDADLIIVDEVSMMGMQLFSVLTQAVKNNSIVILVGDEDQLLSVDYGNVLHDLIKTGKMEVCRLTEVLRQSGLILENAMKINKGILILRETPRSRSRLFLKRRLQKCSCGTMTRIDPRSSAR